MPNLKDFATGTVATAPSPATSGTSLVLQTGEGARMPSVPFYVTACANGVLPTLDNAEKLRVTAVTGDTLTIVRAQGDTTAKSIATGWRISNAIFESDFTGIKLPVNNKSANFVSSFEGKYYVVDTTSATINAELPKITDADIGKMIVFTNLVYGTNDLDVSDWDDTHTSYQTYVVPAQSTMAFLAIANLTFGNTRWFQMPWRDFQSYLDAQLSTISSNYVAYSGSYHPVDLVGQPLLAQSVAVYDPTESMTGVINGDNLTATRQYELPDKDGIIATLADTSNTSKIIALG